MCLDTAVNVRELVRLPCDAEHDVPPLREEYLEMDYAVEMEDCARYIFSPCAYISTGLQVAGNDDGGRLSTGFQAPKLGHSAHVQAGSSSEEIWEDGMRFQEGGSSSSMYDHVSLRLLLGEARRIHLARLLRCSTPEKSVAEAKRKWARLARDLLEKLELLSYEQVRRALITMFLFDPDGMKLQYGENKTRTVELIRNRDRLLHQLKTKNQLFLTPTAESPALATSTHTWKKDAAQSLSMFTTTHPNSFELLSCNVDRGELWDSSLSLHQSGGGLSSSGSSSDSEENND